MASLPIVGRWRWRINDVVPAGQTTRDVRTPKVPRGVARYVNRALVQNVDTNNSLLVISVEQGREATEIYYVKLSTKATWYNIKLEALLFPGEALKYGFSTCTAADDLYVREIGPIYEWTGEGPRRPDEMQIGRAAVLSQIEG